MRYIRSRVPKIEEVRGTRNLIVNYLGENDRKLSQEYDLVVLSVGMQPPKDVKVLAERFGVALNKFNFCQTSTFRPAESSREGIFVAGPFAEPKDIPETVMQASAAAAQVLSLLREARGTLITPKVYPPEREVKGEDAAHRGLCLPLRNQYRRRGQCSRRRGIRQDPTQRRVRGEQSLHLLQRYPGSDQGEDR